jgi:hypothetical protein
LEQQLVQATIALVVATVLLFLVTAYYAKQTRDMVGEMRSARKTTVRPKVVPAYEYYGGGVGFPRVVNVGAGPALDVEVTISFEPGGANKRRWRTPILMPGEFREFTPKGLGPEWSDIPTLTKTFASLELRGVCVDALGDTHPIDESFDLREWWELAAAANERVERGRKSPEVKALELVAKAIRPDIAIP